MWIISEPCQILHDLPVQINPTLIQTIYMSFIYSYFSLHLDNAAIHHMNAAVDQIHTTGGMIVFLPPYSPNVMPCKELFAQTKIDAVWQFLHGSQIIVEDAFL